MSKSISQIVLEYLEGTKIAIVDQQIKQNYDATHESANSLRVETKGNEGTLYGSKAFIFMVYGTGQYKEGTHPPIAALEKWIKARNLTMSPWALAKSIAKRGTRTWRGEREGLDLQSALNVSAEDFRKALGKSYADKIVNMIQTKKQ